MTTVDLPGLPGAELSPLTGDDVAELLVLQRCCWVEEALLNDTLAIPALHETLEDVRDWVKTWTVWQVRLGHRLVGGVRARLDGEDWEIGRLMVAPDLAGRGLGRRLLAHALDAAPASARRCTLFTGARSTRNIAMYQRAGFVLTEHPDPPEGHIDVAVFLVKELAR